MTKEIILPKTLSILSNALNIFANEDKGKEVAPHEVSLFIGTKNDDTCEPCFWMHKKGQPHMRVRKNPNVPNGQEQTCEVSWNQVRGQKVEFLMHIKIGFYSFVPYTLAKFADALGVNPSQVAIMIITGPEKDAKGAPKIVPVPFLCNFTTEDPPKQLSWNKDIFSDEAELELMKAAQDQGEEEQVGSISGQSADGRLKEPEAVEGHVGELGGHHVEMNDNELVNNNPEPETRNS